MYHLVIMKSSVEFRLFLIPFVFCHYETKKLRWYIIFHIDREVFVQCCILYDSPVICFSLYYLPLKIFHHQLNWCFRAMRSCYSMTRQFHHLFLSVTYEYTTSCQIMSHGHGICDIMTVHYSEENTVTIAYWKSSLRKMQMLIKLPQGHFSGRWHYFDYWALQYLLLYRAS